MFSFGYMFWKKRDKKEKTSGKDVKSPEEKRFSPINKLLRESNQKYSIGKEGAKSAEELARDMSSTFPGFLEGDDSFMTQAEQDKAMKSLFPRMAKDVFVELKNGDMKSVFPCSSDAVTGKESSGVAMDAMGATHGPGVHNVPIPGSVKGLPGGIPAGSRPTPGMHQGAGPSQLGKNAAIAGTSLGLLADPMRFPIPPRVLKHFQSRIWITYSGCAIISTHEIVSRACSIPAEEAIAHGYKVICSSHEHSSSEDHESDEARFHYDIKIAADKMGLNETCIQLNYKKKVFGVAIAVPRVKFKKGAKSPTRKGEDYSYEDEYDPKMIEPGSYEGFAVVDPIWVTYQFDEESAQDPISPHFYEPTWIIAYNRKIHRSWCVRVVNVEVPDILKPTYYFGGLSLTQMIYERVWCADKLANEAPLLAMTKRLLIADGNLEQMINDPKHTNVFFKAINYFRDNFSIFVKKPSSNVTQLDTSLAELTPLTMSQYQLVAAIAQIPVTKLLKNVPSGLQATGEYEWDDYAQQLMSIQKHDYTPLLRKHYELYCASNYPDRQDIHLDVEWNPIDVPKEHEIVQMTSQMATSIATLLGVNAATIEESRNMLRRSNLPAYQSMTPQVPELLKKLEMLKDPEKAQQLQMKQQMEAQKMQMQMQAGMQGGGMQVAGGQPQPGGEGQPEAQPQPNVFKDAVAEAQKILGIGGGEEGQGEEEGAEQPSKGQKEAEEGGEEGK